jgi:RNA polymerase primary sigma factor
VELRNQIITELYDCYKANGFITEDEALSLFAYHKTPLHLIDSITEQILAMGVITTTDDDITEQFTDKTKSDYEAFFNEVVTLHPELKPFIEYVRNITPPQTREWQKLIPQAQNGNEYAKNRLIEMYMKVVIRQALYFSKKYHLPLDDTIQNGMVGLMTSIKKYNPADHMKFSTYLPWWITQSISRNRQIYCNPMYFPVHIHENLFSIMNEVEEHICEYCPRYESNICDKLIESVCKKNNWSAGEAKKYIDYLICCKSLDEMAENDIDVSDEMECAYEMQEMSIASDYKKILLDLLNKIEPRLKDVLLMRYGFTGRGKLTLEEVGKVFGVTRERIRQIEEKALRRLRHPTKIIKLKD